MAPTRSGRCDESRSELLDRVLAVLQDRRRREIIAALRESDQRTMTTDELVNRLVERETGRLDSPKLTLHHRHLPMLDDAGLVEFDPRSNTLRYHGDDDVEQWLDRLDEWES